MYYLLKDGTIHRDIKPQNILLHLAAGAKFPEMKIADLGLARDIEGSDYASTAAGTRIYMSPEAHNNHYKTSTDVWSLGCVVFELCTLKPPFVTTYEIISPLKNPTVSDNMSDASFTLLSDICSRMMLRPIAEQNGTLSARNRPNCDTLRADMKNIKQQLQRQA